MPITLIFSLSVTLILLLISVLFRIAGKLRLTIPFVYLLLTGTILNKWASAHETLAFIILYALIALCIFSWIRSFKSKWNERQKAKAIKEDIHWLGFDWGDRFWQTNKAREMGISLNTVHFDTDGNMRYNTSNKMVI